jgi:hypothetical protein
MNTPKKHIVTADPDKGTVEHHIIYQYPPDTRDDRMKAAYMAENYLRRWGEDKAGYFKLNTKAVKIEMDERKVTARTPALYGIKAIWPSSHSPSMLRSILQLSQKLNSH